MDLITPRRKFLITAPLALLLPSGLLTYLGLVMVQGVESRYEMNAQSAVNTIITSVRNRTNQRLEQKILTPFKSIIQDQLERLSPAIPPSKNGVMQFNEKLLYVSLIFIYGGDGVIYFFERSDNPTGAGSRWTQSEAPHSTFTARLKSEIDTEIEKSIEVFNDYGIPPSEEGYPFHPLAYPEDLYPRDIQRELAFFIVLNPQRAATNSALDANHSNGVLAAGFTFNFDYLNQTFFNDILKELWDYPNELQYPITILDKVTQEPVGSINNADFSKVNVSKYIPRLFSDDFPWYRIHFSRYLEDNIMGVARYEKTIYYSLIATANLIMIAGVIGALRNILKELALSDMRSNFVSRVSHELRTPLGLIRLYAETLEMGRIRDSGKQKEYLHSITKESERLTHLINNILDFSQIEFNKKDYAIKEASLEEVVYEAADGMRYHIERHGMSLRLEIEQDLPEIPCDPEALRQAIYNLIFNAIKYSGEGKEIAVSARRINGEAAIEIADRGIGIARDQQKKIFQEFYRVDDPRVRETGGSGLGLAVVKHIVEGHKGRIDVHSEPGKGSVFTIYLPLKRGDSSYKRKS
ncbi:MAG: ATP-binding protein [Candidatus Omnitrophota bacterium]